MKVLLLALTLLAIGLGTGYQVGARHAGERTVRQLRVPVTRRLPVRYRDLGPRLVEAGAIDVALLGRELARRGTPLSEDQRLILREGTDDFVEIGPDNALFLLDVFWALGLTNRNALLTQGPMTMSGLADVGRFASTAGWKLGSRGSNELYASTPIVGLTPEEQERLARVAHAVYRPCCDNPADFPDCNHGMAMLGMLTVLAAGGADEAQMFEAAAAANAAWYPQQYHELRTYLTEVDATSTGATDPRRLVGRTLASASGFRQVHGALSDAGLLEVAPAGSVSAC